MKRFALSTSVVLALASAGAALAAGDTPAQKPALKSDTVTGVQPPSGMATDTDQPIAAVTETEDLLYQKRADEIIGKDVVNGQGETVGTIDDLVLDKGNKVVYAIVSAGGFLGIGEKNVAVRFDELIMANEDEIRISDMAADRLKDAPTYSDDLGYEPVPRDRPVVHDKGARPAQ